MNKIYYGDGVCSLESSKNIISMKIVYKGNMEVTDKTSDNYFLLLSKRRVTIVPQGRIEDDFINNIFEYKGQIRITGAEAINNDREKIYPSIHRVMDYSQLLNTKAEDMTTKSEDLKVDDISKAIVSSTKLMNSKILGPFESGGRLYLANGLKHYGPIHFHTLGFMLMTGKSHTSESQLLYKRVGRELVPYSEYIVNRANKTRSGERGR